jgi:DNA-binding transcriptional LysR family regulator
MVLIPPLAAQISLEAPHLSLDIRHIGESPTQELLANGVIELALGVFFQVPAGIYRQELFRERLICVAQYGHPALHQGTMNAEVFAKQSHILVTSKRGEPGIIDQKLAERSLTRHIAMYIPHFLIAPQIVAQSQLIATLPERAARLFATQLPLTVFDPPIELTTFPISQIWHERTHQSAAHRWLRALLSQKR